MKVHVRLEVVSRGHWILLTAIGVIAMAVLLSFAIAEISSGNVRFLTEVR